MTSVRIDVIRRLLLCQAGHSPSSLDLGSFCHTSSRLVQISLTAALLPNQSSRRSRPHRPHVFHSYFFFKTADFFVARRTGATGGDTTYDLLSLEIEAKIFMSSNLKLRTEVLGFYANLAFHHTFIRKKL